MSESTTTHNHHIGRPSRKSHDVELDPASFIAYRKKKYNTRWKQQNNLAFRQDLSFLQILILYVVLGFIYAIIGGICLSVAEGVAPMVRKEYTNCNSTKDHSLCHTHIAKNRTHATCECEIKVEINEKLAKAKSIYFYYELENYHQNTRDYKKDVDWEQLEGRVIRNGKALKPDCSYSYYMKGLSSKYIYPCGKISNSWFSDRFKMINDATGATVKFKESGIAWKSDVRHFKNPKVGPKKIEQYFDLPRDWHANQKTYFKENKMVENEHFIAWVRCAAFKSFLKKYAQIDGSQLRKGKYTIKIDYAYEVKSFNGKKFIVIRGDSEDKPIDFFFAYTYLSVGVLCLTLGPIFFFVKCIFKSHLKRKYDERQSRIARPSKEIEIPSQSSQNITSGRPSAVSAKIQ